jgi:Sporulation and spore germination
MVTQFSCVSRVFASVVALVMMKGFMMPEAPQQGDLATSSRTEPAVVQPSTESIRPLVQDSEFLALAPQPSASLLLSSAFGQLLNNSDFARQHGSIPANTKLLSLEVKPDGVYVDLSEEFAKGGGSASMINRVTQVVYTATSLNPNAEVYISVAGQKLDENNPLAGEGLMVSYPTTRQQLAVDFAYKY